MGAGNGEKETSSSPRRSLREGTWKKKGDWSRNEPERGLDTDDEKRSGYSA
jgi:hypothetical protein